MGNNNLTLDIITAESLEVLHQKLNFVTNIVTEYDDQYAVEGAKIGSDIRIRLPIQHNTGTGPTIATGTSADSLQSQVTLQVNTQRHVPMRFTSKEMTLDIDKFRERHIEPAISKLCAMIENDAFNMIDEVHNQVSAGTKCNFTDILEGGVGLNDALAPFGQRYALLDSRANADMVDDVKGLFHDSGNISKQYKDGLMGRTAGYEFYLNTLLPSHTSGAEGGGSAYLTNDATAQKGVYSTPNSMSLVVDTGTKTVKEGDVFTIVGVFDVHPESKVTRAELKQFTVLADFTGAGTITCSPAIISSGPYKNCSASAANNQKLVFVGAASTAYKQSLLFQKGFACFGTADLVLPPGEKASRLNKDGISLRIIQDYYDGVKDRLYTRLDILYGYKVLRPSLAVKVLHT